MSATTARYFSESGEELDESRITTARAEVVGKTKGDGRKALWSDSFSVFVALSEAPDEMWNFEKAVLVARRINYKNNPSGHKCGAKCRNAKGGTCECECGGKFHGANS